MPRGTWQGGGGVWVVRIPLGLTTGRGRLTQFDHLGLCACNRVLDGACAHSLCFRFSETVAAAGGSVVVVVVVVVLLLLVVVVVAVVVVRYQW